MHKPNLPMSMPDKEDVHKSLAEYAAMLQDRGDIEKAVNSPTHYKIFPDMEVVDVIKKALTLEEWKGYCKGNVLKYKLRAGEKDNVQQDLGKAAKYQEWLGDEY